MCNECGRSGVCHPRCPNYEPSKTSHYCSICDDGIYDGEDYVENFDGEYAHWDCLDNKRELAEWVGIDIRTMEND